MEKEQKALLLKKYWISEEHRINHLKTLKNYLSEQNKKETQTTLPTYKHLTIEEIDN